MTEYTTGLDLGDRKSRYCVLDTRGDEIEVGEVKTTKLALEQRFPPARKMRIALEVGTHSGWVSRLLTRLGHEVIVANARNLAYITRANDKSDRNDAAKLAMLARTDPRQLSPIRHRSESAQVDLILLRTRNELVGVRTSLVNHVRGVVKSMGERLPACSTPVFATKVRGAIPDALRTALEPALEMIKQLSAQINACLKRIRKLSKEHPVMTQLQEISGVGAVTAAAFVLTLEDPTRFRKSRDVGPYLGLVPGQRQSGDSDPQLRITKAGDKYLRMLLVQCAQYILGPFAEDSDLRRWGLKKAQRAGKRSKKCAVVAVARKVAVLMHMLWAKNRSYRPLREPTTTPVAAARA